MKISHEEQAHYINNNNILKVVQVTEKRQLGKL